MSINADPQAYENLALNLIKDLMMIQSINDEMRANLDRLGATFLDDYYENVVSSVNFAQRKLTEAIPMVTDISVNICYLAEILRRNR